MEGGMSVLAFLRECVTLALFLAVLYGWATVGPILIG
jgi:hypothetical protein